MRRFVPVELILAGFIAAVPWLLAQAPATGDPAATGQSKPAGQSQQPAKTQPQSNPFPEDTSTVPVMPSKGTPVLPEGTYRGDEDAYGSARVPLPGDDLDPARSPDDPTPAAGSGQQEDSSSSLSGLEKLIPLPDDDQTGRKKKKEKEPTHQEAAAEDINVGGYYLDRKNWKAAYSRFESALILDPENPDVYWGLAEAERQLGDLANARAHYEKVLEYDPDSRHGKEARKVLKDPALANAKKAAPVLEQPK